MAIKHFDLEGVADFWELIKRKIASAFGFGKVKVGSTTIEADDVMDTLTLEAGSNVTLTPDATADKVTIAAKGTTVVDNLTSTSATDALSANMGRTLNGKIAKFLKHQSPSDVSSIAFTLECEHINILSGFVFSSSWSSPTTAFAPGGAGGVYAFSVRPSTSEVGFLAIKEPASIYKISSMSWDNTTKQLTLYYNAASTKFVNVIYS